MLQPFCLSMSVDIERHFLFLCCNNVKGMPAQEGSGMHTGRLFLGVTHLKHRCPLAQNAQVAGTG